MNTSGPAARPTAPSVRLIGGVSARPAMIDQQPHRRDDRRALELAAGVVGADPEDVHADDDADRRQHAREVGEDAVGIGAVPRPRAPAPRVVRRERPDADEREHQHDRLEQRVHRAEREQHRGDRIADAGRPRCWPRLRRERRRRIGQHQHADRERRRRPPRQSAAASDAHQRARAVPRAPRPRCRAAARPRRSAARRSGRRRWPLRSAPRRRRAAAPRPASAAGRRR